MITPSVIECNLLKNILMMFLVLLISFGYLLDNVHANVQRFCGNNLVEAFSLVCPHGYKHKLQKRNGNDFDYDTLANDIFTLETSGYSQPPLPSSDTSSNVDDSAVTPPPSFAASPFLTSLYNSMMLTQAHRRQRRRIVGAYDECCRKPCSIDEISAYCHEP